MRYHYINVVCFLYWDKYILSFDVINLPVQCCFLPIPEIRLITKYWSLFLFSSIIHSVFISNSSQLFISLWSWETPLINHLVSHEMGYVKITSLWFGTDVISSDANIILGNRENILSGKSSKCQHLLLTRGQWTRPVSCNNETDGNSDVWNFTGHFLQKT